MESGLSLGKLFGIRIRVHYSWFFIFVLVTAFLALEVFPHNLPFGSKVEFWTLGAVTSLLFFASVLVHELAHSLIGRANGIPVGTITLFFFGGGATFSKDPDKPSDEFKTAAAGPVSSLVLASLFFFIYSGAYGARGLAVVTLWLAQINLILALFNLLPGLPLDGGRILRAAVWQRTGNLGRATRIASISGRVLGYLFIAFGIAMIPLYGDWLGGIWLAILGWFVADTAGATERQFHLQQLLKGANIRQLMADCPRIDADTLLSRLTITPQHSCFLVTRDDKPVAFLTTEKLKTVQSSESESSAISPATQLDNLPRMTVEQDGLAAARLIYDSGRDEVTVYDGEKLVGLVTLDDLIDFANSHESQPRR